MTWFANYPVKEYGAFDVSYLKNALLEISETIWDQDTRNKNNQHFYETSTLWLRNMPGSHYGHNEIFHVFEHVKFDHREFETLCDKFHQEFESAFNGRLIRSCIIRLLPGQIVEKHIDGDDNLHRYCHRLILPIITNPQVIMTCDGTDDYPASTHILEENITYDTNGYVPHEVVNHGTTTRYAFVLDFLSDKEPNPMTVKMYPTWTEEDWITVSNQGKRRSLSADMKYPAIKESTAWLELYNSQKKKLT